MLSPPSVWWSPPEDGMLWPQQRLPKLQKAQDQGCQRCEKSKRDCPGYDRGEGIIWIRNETGLVSKRSQNQKKCSTEADILVPPSETESSSVTQGRSEEHAPDLSVQHQPRKLVLAAKINVSTSQISDASANIAMGKALVRHGTPPVAIAHRFVPLGLPQDPEQQSLAFFMSKFAHDRRSEEIWGGSLEALPSLLNRAGAVSPLAAAAKTTAMGSIAWIPTCSHFKSKSVQRYVTSVKSINGALQDSKLSRSDNLLMAVLMLSFYENIKSLTLQRSARELHVKGAVALIKARKPESFHNRTSLRLYLAVRGQLLGQCIEKCDPAPFQDFLSATEGAIPDNFVPSCADYLVSLCMKLPTLRFREKRMLDETNIVKKRTAAQELLNDAQGADRDLDSWTWTLPKEFHYTSFQLQGCTRDSGAIPDAYPSSEDIYCDYASASTWNAWRIRRIQVLCMIMNCAEILGPSHGRGEPAIEYGNALRVIGRLVDDICSSVPFHLGHHEAPGGGRAVFANYPHPPGQAKWPDNFAASGAVGGWLMMQPLSFVARLDCVPSIQRDWVKEYLTSFMRDPRDMTRRPPAS
ncbi:MAG: hypothetical protein Q9163_001126 [Psora crenata]